MRFIQSRAQRFHRFLEELVWRVLRLSQTVQILAGILCIAVVAVVDRLAGEDVSLSFFYLPPLMLVAWAAGPKLGIPTAILAALAERFFIISERIPVGVRLWNSGIRVLTFLAVISLLEMLKELLRKERDLSRCDFLTGLMNSRAYYERAQLEISRSSGSGEQLLILYLDCDNFKTVNDTLGHAKGDELLQNIARTLRRGIREQDAVARLGGDEFAVLMVGGFTAESAKALASELHRDLTAEVQKSDFPVTFSVGAVLFQEPPPNVKEMIHLADELMYSVKRAGKNQVLLEVRHGDEMVQIALAESNSALRNGGV